MKMKHHLEGHILCCSNQCIMQRLCTCHVMPNSGSVQDRIQKSMSKDMVEPKRKYIDVESTWKKKLLNKAAGPGGLLIVTMVQARDLRCCIDLKRSQTTTCTVCIRLCH